MNMKNKTEELVDSSKIIPANSTDLIYQKIKQRASDELNYVLHQAAVDFHHALGLSGGHDEMILINGELFREGAVIQGLLETAYNKHIDKRIHEAVTAFMEEVAAFNGESGMGSK